MEGRGPGPELQQAPWPLLGRGNARHVPPDPRSWRVPPCCSLFFFPHLPPSYALKTHMAREGPRKPGDQTQKPNRLPGAKGGGTAFCASPDPPVLEGPPQSTSPPLPTSSLPPTSLGPMRSGGGCKEWRTRPGSSAGFPGPSRAEETLGLLLSDSPASEGPSRRGNPFRLPATPQGHRYCPASTPPPPSLPPCPTWLLRYSCHDLGR